jgi:hypothetical protein
MAPPRRDIVAVVVRPAVARTKLVPAEEVAGAAATREWGKTKYTLRETKPAWGKRESPPRSVVPCGGRYGRRGHGTDERIAAQPTAAVRGSDRIDSHGTVRVVVREATLGGLGRKKDGEKRNSFHRDRSRRGPMKL